jgi:E3 ubiquitin-protein ligase HUWE1
VLNLLVPAALAAEEKRKEKERLLKEEKEAAKQREEEEAKKAEEARQKEEHRATKEAQMEIETAPTENFNISSSLAPASSTVVTVHGTNIDLANTGIDPTFLEALPDDLRAEVLAQHLREQRMISSNSFPSEISEEFMQALPEDIREELVRQEMVDRMQRERPARDIEIPFLNDRSGVATGPLGGGSRPGSAKKRPAADGSVIQKEPPQLIDRLALLPFIRMLFVSQPLGKSYLQQLFIHLCENAKTREDLISLLLSIVQECCNSEGFNPSQSAISKGKSSKTQQSHRRSSAAASAGLLKNIIGSAAFALGSPELFCTAVQRCLATCLELVTADENVAKFFLSEVDVDRLALLPSPAGSGNTVSTKTKRSKIYSDQPPRTTYPLVVLLSLLEKPIFLLNTQLMDQITQLIAAVSRPLLSITEKLVTAPVAEVSASSQPFA